MEEFSWTLEQYIQKGKENGVSGEWIKELENASAKYHISYLEAMKLQIQQYAEILYSEYEKGVTDFLEESFKNQFYKTAFEIAKGTGVGTNLAIIDTRKIDAILKKPWAQDGKMFSDRIWQNKEKLVRELHAELTQCIIRGASPQKAISNLAKKMNVSKSQAGNLIMTESAAISSAARKECFGELGVDWYQFDATLDGKTCDVCGALDGKVFKMSEYEIGITANPIHPRCRCCTAPYYDDWEELSITRKRVARDPITGKEYKVPAEMTYEEWMDKYVKNDILNSADTKEVIRVHSIGKLDRNIYKCITDDIVTDEVIITDERIQHIMERHPSDYERYYEYLKEIIEHPQYIVETNKPYTALILKEFIEGEEQFKTVLRLTTSHDNPDFKNSIITFMKINDKEWKRMLKNKRILYKEG